MNPHFVVLVGSATPPGRTQTMASALAELIRVQRETAHVDIVDLVNVALQAADGRPLEAYDATIREAVERLASARGVVVASPVYRATYAGVLKNFLDIVPFEALHGKPVGLAVLGGSLHHYLGVDDALRAVLAWYGALALPTSVYLCGTDFDERKALTARARAELAGLAGALVTLTDALAGKTLGPAPLAAPRP